MGRSKISVDAWCGERLEKAGDPMVVDGHQGNGGGWSPGTDSCGKGFYNKPRLVVVCSATDDNGNGTTRSVTFSKLNYSLQF